MKRFHWISLIVTGLTVAACAGRRGGNEGSVAHSIPSTRSGDIIYREDCARCHGPQGEGVAGQYDETLYGEQSMTSLARYIHRTMPDDRKERPRKPMPERSLNSSTERFIRPKPAPEIPPHGSSSVASPSGATANQSPTC